MITKLELDKCESNGLEPYSHNKYNGNNREEGYQTTSDEEQTKCSEGSQISNICDEWSSLEVCYKDIEDATNGLSESSNIGKGGYGSVYKGKLGSTIVAIKMLDSSSKQGQKEFFQELKVLYQMWHPHLVELVGACFEVHALIYKFLPNGSLEDCLKNSPSLLTWRMRTRIIYEICSSLAYLHSKLVVHGDVKPANILLDANFKSKLSDFGFSRFLPKGMASDVYLETDPKGTSGYIDPWLLERSILRPGSDLYSFGITILKLLTGLPPVGLDRKAQDADKKSFRKMIDPTAGRWPFKFAEVLLYWGLQCCYHNEKSSELLEDMSLCLAEMLDDIETLPEGRFKLAKRVQKKTGKKVELRMPLPPSKVAEKKEEEKDEEMSKVEEEKAKVEGKKEVPVVITVVLKVHIHCEACALVLKKRILRMKGVQFVELELKVSQVTVKGVFDPPKLVKCIKRRTSIAIVIKVEPVVKKPKKRSQREKGRGKIEKKDDKKDEWDKARRRLWHQGRKEVSARGSCFGSPSGPVNAPDTTPKFKICNKGQWL